VDHWHLNEDYSPVTTNGIDGGDLSTVSAVVRAPLRRREQCLPHRRRPLPNKSGEDGEHPPQRTVQTFMPVARRARYDLPAVQVGVGLALRHALVTVGLDPHQQPLPSASVFGVPVRRDHASSP
jgi:hypothetical protein